MTSVDQDLLNMTEYEYAAKQQVVLALAKAGYVTFARVMKEFWVHLTNDPDVVAYISAKDGTITFNVGLDIRQVSFIARHEILHEYFLHHSRMIKHFAERLGLKDDNGNPIRFEDLTLEQIDEIANMVYSNDLHNIAKDYEISNRSYTKADKRTARSIYLNGQVLKGLVTEDDHPDWVKLTAEEMYDKLAKEKQIEWDKMQKELENEEDKDMVQPPDDIGGGWGGLPPWLEPPVQQVKVIDGELLPDGTFIDSTGKKRN